MTQATLPEMPCQEFVERVTDYLEGAMGADDRARLELHLADCRHCALYLDQLRETLALGGELAADDLTPTMRGALLGVFDAWQADGRPAGDDEDPRSGSG